jgi:hypothetical protein
MTILITPVRPWPFNTAGRQALETRIPSPFERFRAAYPEFLERLSLDRQYRDRQFDMIGHGSPSEQRDHVRKLLRDKKLHRLYAFHAVRQAHRSACNTPDTVRALATSCNTFAPVTDEPATLRLIAKGSGRRWVYDFGLRRRMQQRLVADILRRLHPPPRSQRLFNGGMPAALKAVATAFQEGFTHGKEVDLRDFYGSVRPNGLAEYLRPLPTTVVDNVVWDTSLRSSPSRIAVVGATTLLTPNGSAGLFLGASTSPIVGERIIARLLAAAQLPDTITYADNLFVTGRSAAEVEERIHRIRESAATLEVGPLGTGEAYSSNFDLSEPFEFLKRYGVRREEGFSWEPGEKKLTQYQIGGAEYKLTEAEIEKAEHRVRHWRRSYKNWSGGDEREAVFLAELAARRYYINRNPSNLTACIHAIAAAYYASGFNRLPSEFLPEEGDLKGENRKTLLQNFEIWHRTALGHNVNEIPVEP